MLGKLPSVQYLGSRYGYRRTLQVTLVSLSVVGAAALTTSSCKQIAAPTVPLTLSDTAIWIDGMPLPAALADGATTTTYVVQFTIDLTADGMWTAGGWRYPEGRARADVSEFRDNGYYTFDGRTLLLHSNFTHTDWPATVGGDTIMVSAVLPFSRARHLIALTH